MHKMILLLCIDAAEHRRARACGVLKLSKNIMRDDEGVIREKEGYVTLRDIPTFAKRPKVLK